MTLEEIDKEIAEKLMDNEQHCYSTDLVQAARLLQKLHDQGWFWRLDSKHDSIICTLQNIKRQTFSIEAKTIAQAICETALRTVVNGKEEKTTS